jgi:hypothetical protein
MTEITIPKPCTERFDKMSPTAKGAFCATCQTEVINLKNSGYDDIIAYANRPAIQKTCVRIAPSQLETASTMRWYEAISARSQLKFMFMLSLVLVFGNATAAGHRQDAVGGIADRTAQPDAEDHDFVGGIAIQIPDSTGHYPEKMNLVIEEDSIADFVFTLRENRIYVEYESTKNIVVTVTAAYEVPDDDTSYTFHQEIIHKDQQQVLKGKHSLEIPLEQDRHLAIYLTLRWNGGSETVVLLPKTPYWFSGSKY